MVNRITLALSLLLVVVAIAVVGYMALTFRAEAQPAQAGTIALAPAAPQATSDSNLGIIVSGEGRARVKPDIAVTTIGVDITSATLADATSQANTKTAAIIAKLKSMGIDDNDIQTINYNVNPITKPLSNDAVPSITGYHVSNQLKVTVRKIDDLGKVLDAAVGAGANSISGVSFTVSDAKPLQAQARTAAIKDAQDKADQLAKGAGLQLGKMVMLSEGTSGPVPFARADAAFAAPSAAVPVQTGEIEIVVNVDARFAIQ